MQAQTPQAQNQTQTKEEKQLDASLEDLLQRVRELKQSISGFIYKLENDYQNINWPNMMEHFGVLSSGLTTLKRLLKSEKMPLLRNYALFPILLSPDRDPNLEKLTEGRILAFNHEVVPDYLRTKPDPEVEDKLTHISLRASTMTPEPATKQLTMLNKVTSNLLDLINATDDPDKDSSLKNALPQTYSSQETGQIIAAITKGARIRRAEPVQPQMPGGQMGGMMPQQMPQAVIQQKPMMPGSSIGRAQSTIKTNIKAAASSHPYQRP